MFIALAQADSIGLLLAQIGLILALSRLVGALFARLRQPQVMGEMIAGIMLGPSLLGLLWPTGYGAIFPPVSIGYLDYVSQIGVIFFLFLVGLELEPSLIRSRGRAALAISLASILLPFVLGAALTWHMYYRSGQALFDSHRVSFGAAAMFMGAAMSITAFPVLARILTERNLHKTNLGAVAITCAAVNDVAAWCLLAVVIAVARVQNPTHALWTVGLATVYVGLMFLLVRPFLSRLEIVYERQGRLSQNVVAVIFMLVLASSFATAAIGIHALFGAFMMGVIMPKSTPFIRHLAEKLEDYTVVLFLPVFFAYTGIKTNLNLLLADPHLWMYAGLVTAVACAGKIGGAMLAARFCRLGWRESSAIGILMNTRGLMELIILNIGLQLAVINHNVFAMMVLMTLVTTALTSPLLQWIYPARRLGVPDQRQAGYSILIPVSLPKSGGPLVQLADALIGPERNGARLYALHLRRPADHEAYRTGLDEADSPRDEALAPLLAQARNRSLPVEPLSLVSREVAGDICALAAQRKVNLVLMGFHKPVIGRTILGGTVHRVLSHCEAHVAIFVDRGFRSARRILVPYLGSNHDHLALELAYRMARNVGAQVTVLHVVPPMRSEAGKTLNAKGAVERVFNDPLSPTPVVFRIVEDPSPVGVVLYQAQQFDLVIVGVAEEWGLESHLFGWRPERIARDCPCSLVIVRKHGGASLAGVPPV